MLTIPNLQSALLLLASAASTANALNNGVAETPPMGWCSWQRYRCVTACNDTTSKVSFRFGCPVMFLSDCVQGSAARDRKIAHSLISRHWLHQPWWTRTIFAQNVDRSFE